MSEFPFFFLPGGGVGGDTKPGFSRRWQYALRLAGPASSITQRILSLRRSIIMHSRPHGCECHLRMLLASLKVTATRVGRWKPGRHQAEVGGDSRRQIRDAWLYCERNLNSENPGAPPDTYLQLFSGSHLKTNKRKLKDSWIACILIPGLQERFHYPNSETQQPAFLSELAPGPG